MTNQQFFVKRASIENDYTNINPYSDNQVTAANCKSQLTDYGSKIQFKQENVGSLNKNKHNSTASLNLKKSQMARPQVYH